MSLTRISTRDVKGLILNRLASPTMLPWIERHSFYSPSDQASEKYPWLGRAPMLRQMIGGRQVKQLTEFGITIENLDFESTLGIHDKDMRRDKIGQVQVRVNEMGDQADRHWASLISALINNGHTQLCYDSQFFFDSDHVSDNSGALSNLLTYNVATPATPTVAEFQAAVFAAIQAFFGFKDENGEPINEDLSTFDVMVPVNYWGIATQALVNPVTSGGETNPLQNMGGDKMINVVANARLTATDKFFIFGDGGEVNSFIRQEEVSPEVSVLTEGSDHFFKHREHLFGIYASRNAGYGLWQRAVSMQLT